jgi:mRNA-degrading endonuclease toxin of MazEF toxin-antitoxin module
LINPTEIKVGSIYRVDLNVDAIGHEQTKERPAIVVAKHSDTSICVVIPLTTQSDVLRFAYTHSIKKTYENGLQQDSYALIFHVRAIDSKKRIIKNIGDLDDENLMYILKQLSDYLGLP